MKSAQIQQIEQKRLSVNALFAARLLVFVFCPEFGSLVESFGFAVGSRVNDHVVLSFWALFLHAVIFSDFVISDRSLWGKRGRARSHVTASAVCSCWEREPELNTQALRLLRRTRTISLLGSLSPPRRLFVNFFGHCKDYYSGGRSGFGETGNETQEARRET